MKAKVKPRSKDMLGRFLAKINIHDQDVFFTYRLPFQDMATIVVPEWAWRNLEHPVVKDVLDHEKVHVVQFSKWYGPILILLGVSLLPLPFLFSGRWFVERRAYLHDIRKGRCTLNQAVEVLWSEYGWAWPRFLMRRWFNKELSK